ncbi:MAG TPA: alginate export family protein [Clostridia bacterium]|nr:alginate export family protein [Clostridia bacterium]
MTSKTITFLLVATAALPVWAQTAAEPPPSAFEQFLNDTKHPVSWLTWGADFRPRNEYFDTILTLSESAALSEQDVMRFRTRLWASAMPVTNLLFNTRIAAEPRLWLKPAFAGQYRGQSGMEWRYGIMDNLNVQWKQVLDQPLTITAGRQDILLGDYYDWWLVADGTPGDGSWTFFLDSARLTYDLKEAATRLDLIYIYQNPQPDEVLPTLDYSKSYALTDQREQGVIVYASNKSLKNVQADGYFIYKHDDQVYPGIGDNADIYTLGGKITGTPFEHVQFSVEGAYQFGYKEDRILGVFDSRELDAFGGKGKLTYLFKDKWNNQISLVGEYLSGDDPETRGKDEMFDILWGRWPRWSELYIYSYAPETGGRIAQMNNVARFGAAWSVNPVKKMTVSAMYNALYAPEDTPTRAVAPAFSGDGHFRGHYLQSILKYQFSKNIAGHLWGEWVWEGDYYAQRDLMTFVRAEVLFTF